MALFQGPKIVTDGLAICLDAADKNCYPGSGTSVTDLTANGNNMVLKNGASVLSDNTINFDGVNDYSNIGSDSTWKTGTISIMVWAYAANWAAYASDNKRLYSCTESAGWNMSVGVAGSGNGSFTVNDLGVFVYADSQYNLVSIALSSIPSGWNHFTVTVSTSVVTLYMNGTSVDTQSKTGSGEITYNATNSLIFGAEAASGATPAGSGFNYLDGVIGPFMLYNRPLSDKEVYQNFTAQRSRFNSGLLS
tara:strand:- start:165 stop:911 length:747 start_codon:yes stop_codon:yes gene_type:complete